MSVAQTDSRGHGSPASLHRVQVPEVRALALRAPRNSPAGAGVAWNAPGGRGLQKVGRGQIPRRLLRPAVVVERALVREAPLCAPGPMRRWRRGRWGRQGRGERDINVTAHVIRVPTGMYVGIVGILPAQPAVPHPLRGAVFVEAGVAPKSWWASLGCVAPPVQQSNVQRPWQRLCLASCGSGHLQAPLGGAEL